MKRPGWAIAIGIIMLLFGGCGAFNRAGDLMLPELTELMNESMVEAQKGYDDGTIGVTVDSVDTKNGKKLEDLSADEKKMLDMFSDTILVDENNNVDMDATMQNSIKISDYRQTWIVRFAYIGLFIAVLFILGGIMLLGYKKYTIKIVITAIALSMVSNILQIIIYAADKDSGSIIDTFGNIGIYFSLALDILLMILILVLDKTFFRPTVITEDYYD